MDFKIFEIWILFKWEGEIFLWIFFIGFSFWKLGLIGNGDLAYLELILKGVRLPLEPMVLFPLTESKLAMMDFRFGTSLKLVKVGNKLCKRALDSIKRLVTNE